MRVIYRTVLVFPLALALTACATASRGGTTMFAVETIPEGAAVTTDLELPQRKIEKDEQGNVTARYYGCQPTPCGFELPRRSDFNVLIAKPGHQPSTHAVYKDRNRKQAKTNEKAAVGTVAAGTATLGAVAATSTHAGSFAVISSPALAGASVGVIYGIPVVGVFTGVDLASGALIDLNPNPLNVELIPEIDPEETKELIAAFDRSRSQ